MVLTNDKWKKWFIGLEAWAWLKLSSSELWQPTVRLQPVLVYKNIYFYIICLFKSKWEEG